MVKKKIKPAKTNKEIVVALKAELNAVKKEIQNDVVGPVVASFGFIIALVWRDAIKSALDEYLLKTGLMDQAYLYNFVSAILVTIAVIVIMVSVTKLGRSHKTERIKKAVKKAKKKLDV